MKKHQTNVEFLSHAMVNSEFGPLKEIFIINAIDNYTKAVLMDKTPGPFHDHISPRVWKQIAEEMWAEIALQYDKKTPQQYKNSTLEDYNCK